MSEDKPKPDSEQPPEEDGGAVSESYRREDERWKRSSQLRDWVVLFLLAAFWFTWMFIIFLFEPGIR